MANKRSFRSNNEDLINKLPDELLARILSFIDTRSAVATTFVSKRWNRLWISVPNLDLLYDWYERPSNKDRYERFIDRVLMSNSVTSVRTICFFGWISTKVSLLNSWLASIARRDAERIMLSLGSQLYYMPDCFFHNKLLVHLSFDNFNCQVPPSVCFPCLRTIRFQSLRLRDNHSLKNLLSGCPVLTDLYMAVLEWDDPKLITLDVRSPTLLALRIRIDDRLKAFYYKVVIDAPNVNTLVLTDHTAADYYIRHVSSCTDITLHFIDGGQVLCELLKRMIQARELTLTFDSKTPFKGSIENMPMFRNLIKLKTLIAKDEHWLCVFRLIHCAPNLVTFELVELDSGDITPNICIWEEPNELPHCFVSSLKTVELELCFVENVKKTMISYILKNALVLKYMYVHVDIVDTDMEQKDELRRILSTLQKSSDECQVSYEDCQELADRINGVVKEE